MFLVEKPSMLNALAQGAMGEQVPNGRISLYNMLDDKSLEKIAENAGWKLWRRFVTFGSASAGVLAVFVIFHIGKIVIDSLIRGYAIHSVYGCSIHILGAIWSSITHLLIQRGQKRDRDAANTPEPDVALPLVVTHSPTPGIPSDHPKESAPPAEERADTSHVTRTYGELNKYLSNLGKPME